jgi:hypothetical protein
MPSKASLGYVRRGINDPGLGLTYAALAVCMLLFCIGLNRYQILHLLATSYYFALIPS